MPGKAGHIILQQIKQPKMARLTVVEADDGAEHFLLARSGFLPARASEQGNVIGSVRIYIYIYMCVQKKL